MYQAPGIILIRTVFGRRGPFSVGTLTLDIGEFVVKDKRFDQFEEGEYEGTFTIAKIGPSSYVSNGRIIIEVTAKLADFRLETQAPVDDVPGIEEAEPADDDEPAPLAPASVEEPAASAEPEHEAVATEEEADDPDTADAALFGALWPSIRDARSGDRVKLDSTLPRDRFRSQVARIGKAGLGWTFDALPQQWVKP